MCLSTAYSTKDGVDTFICDRVTNVSVDGDKVSLTTLLGVHKVVEGILKDVDLNRNTIKIEAK